MESFWKQMGTALIRLRIDVDYPHSSRIKSFFYTAVGVRPGKDYLKNSKTIARMINRSPKDVKAYWFFTLRTVPDRELLQVIDNPKHEVALHIVNDPFTELKNMENKTGRKMYYYTIHGTDRLLARLMWRRFRTKAPKIPDDFPLDSFHRFAVVGIDGLCYVYAQDRVKEMVSEAIRKGEIIYFHPIWLFQRGKLNHRGPFYEVLRWMLDVDQQP